MCFWKHRSISRKQKTPVCFQPLSDRLSGVISHCSHACSKYLTLPTLLLSWPLTSIHTAVLPAQGQPAVSAAEKWAVIHNPPHHLPEAIDFCFPNLQKRSRGKIKNTVSLELNKDAERERERRFTLLKRYFTQNHSNMSYFLSLFHYFLKISLHVF